MMRVLCDVCFEETGGKNAIPVSIKSGAIRIRTHLCPDCIALADDVQEVMARMFVGDPPPLPDGVCNKVEDRA